MARGKLIVMEGLDGSGKATQTGLLCQYLESRGRRVRHIEFPDYREPSSALVKMYLNKEFGSNPGDVNAYAASSFYAVDRYASFLRFWRKDYLSGATIVADRYTTSNAVYQMEKTPREDWNKYLAWLQDYEYGKLQLPRPDLVLFLDMPTEISQRLLSGRYAGDERKKDLHESNVEFFNPMPPDRPLRGGGDGMAYGVLLSGGSAAEDRGYSKRYPGNRFPEAVTGVCRWKLFEIYSKNRNKAFFDK